MTDTKPRLQDRYEQTIRKELADKNGYTNPHQIPRVEKITINNSKTHKKIQCSQLLLSEQ